MRKCQDGLISFHEQESDPSTVYEPAISVSHAYKLADVRVPIVHRLLENFDFTCTSSNEAETKVVRVKRQKQNSQYVKVSIYTYNISVAGVSDSRNGDGDAKILV